MRAKRGVSSKLLFNIQSTIEAWRKDVALLVWNPLKPIIYSHGSSRKTQVASPEATNRTESICKSKNWCNLIVADCLNERSRKPLLLFTSVIGSLAQSD